MKVSIIIPCKEVDSFAEECIENCERLDYDDYECILLPDNETRKIEGVKVIPTGPLTPGAKRNIGVENSSGEILAFVDSDAYPRKDWLRNAVKYFNDPRIAAVGGPGITPEEDGAMQRAGGYVLSSFMVGSLSSRYKANQAYESIDVHSCNFIARRDSLEKVRWDEKYWPGEDTLMCLGIKKLGRKMMEAPDVVVCHHRRPLFIPHLRQVSRFGMHRGFFAKKYPETSLKPVYLLPTLLVIFLAAGIILSLFSPVFKQIFLYVLAGYLLLALISSLKRAELALPVWLGIIATHITYGVFFMMGLLRRDLER